MGRSTYVTLSRVLLAVAVALLAGGLIYDATRDGTEPNLSMLYFVAVAIGLSPCGSACAPAEPAAAEHRTRRLRRAAYAQAIVINRSGTAHAHADV